MNNRVIYFLDSPVSDDLYYYLCINMPEELLDGILELNNSDLLSFEKFYFANKNSINVSYYVADRQFIAFLGYFAVLLKTKRTEESTLLSDIIDIVYTTHSCEKNKAVVEERNSDLLLEYVDVIYNELSHRDESTSTILQSRCKDLSSSIIRGDFNSSVPSFSDDIILFKGYSILRDQLTKWIDGESHFAFQRKMFWPPEKMDSALDNFSVSWQSSAHELEILDVFCRTMSSMVWRVIYDFENMSEEDKHHFVSLWLFMMTIRVKGVLPTSFINSVNKIVDQIQNQ